MSVDLAYQRQHWQWVDQIQSAPNENYPTMVGAFGK